ncbi:MAG: glycosyltransferase involved in cell wall biosynthesis [Gammaproteobacteria bacterium]|jgi:glycosyltransferase involved in cell wall biosynthesis
MARPKLSVLQILPSLRGGGVEQGTVDVCAALVANGHRALVMSAGGPMVQAVQACGGEHLQWAVGNKSVLTLRFVPRLRRLLRDQHIDIVHPRSRLPAWVTWLAWRSMQSHTRPRLVTSVHGFYSPGRYSAVMTRGERVICVSNAIREYVLDTFPQVPASRLSVIHRGVDPCLYPHGFHACPNWQRKWNKEHPEFAQAKVILLPGRLTRLKGHAQFINLIGRLRQQGMNVHGVIAGGIDPRRVAYADELQRRVRREQLGDRVHFLGHRADLREIMSVSDLVLSLSSKPESFGRTVLEGLSLGRPVAGFAHGGVGEILHALYPQGLIAVGDAAALLAATTRLLNAPAPVAVVRNFTLQQMLDQTLELYHDLATTRHERLGKQ